LKITVQNEQQGASGGGMLVATQSAADAMDEPCTARALPQNKIAALLATSRFCKSNVVSATLLLLSDGCSGLEHNSPKNFVGR